MQSINNSAGRSGMAPPPTLQELANSMFAVCHSNRRRAWAAASAAACCATRPPPRGFTPGRSPLLASHSASRAAPATQGGLQVRVRGGR